MPTDTAPLHAIATATLATTLASETHDLATFTEMLTGTAARAEADPESSEAQMDLVRQCAMVTTATERIDALARELSGRARYFGRGGSRS